MRTEVRITQAQADAHHSGLLAAIGATAPDSERWIARRERRREARQRRARSYAWRRRLAQA
ncbi:MAG TPA: hypothetical protein VK964_18580 [Nocardioidaceae bacterium]|jgi:hypothetical protein|nr:hypothetical protein [Nocardioidaceae bacterium]